MCNLAEIKIDNMRELKELGFGYMPTLNEFVKKKYSLLVIANKDCKGWDFSPSDFENTLKYANLIDQQPKLGDFIPCIDGVPVDEPKEFKSFEETPQAYLNTSKGSVMVDYEQALEQVKFEGWKLYHNKSEGDWCVTNGTCWFESLANPTYEQAINDGVKLKIK